MGGNGYGIVYNTLSPLAPAMAERV